MRIVSAWHDKEDRIILIYRKGDRKFKRVISDFKPYFLINIRDRLSNKVEELQEKKKISRIEVEGSYAKLFVNSVGQLPFIRDELERWKIQTYESDIPFVRRYMIDNLVPIGTDPLKFLFIDIETDDTNREIKIGEYPILSIACMDMEKNKKFFINDGSEEEMLKNFINFAKNYDVLVAWNGENFDFPYIEKRLKYNKIYFPFNRFWQVVDLMWEYMGRKSVSSYSLDNVAKIELGKRKIEFEGRIVDLWKNDRLKLMEYNMNDVELMYLLEKKYNILKFLDTMSSKTNCFVSELKYPTIIVDNCILRKVRELKLNVRFPYKKRAKREQYEGGFVLEPKYGLHKNILILDFTSLYNKIMQSWNISPEVLNKGKERIFVPDSNITFSKEKKGMIPLILEELEKEREYYKKKRNESDPKSEEYKKFDMLQYSVKTILLSFYGVMGNPTSRYYHKDIAGSVTKIGRWLIKISKKIIEDKGYEVIYIDTDSLMIKINESELEKQIEIGNKLTMELNNFYFKLLENFNIPAEDRKIEMKFEKILTQIIFIGDEKKATKKRYAGRQVWEEGRKVKKLLIRGLEYVRTDWIKTARNLQKDVINMILDGKGKEEILSMLVEYKKRVENNKLKKDELIISQKLTKPINSYKTLIPHVKVAKQMIKEGEEVYVGTKIPYIYIKGEDGKPEPIYVKHFKNNYDAEYYWNSKIFPATERVLTSVFPEYDWTTLYIKNNNSNKRRRKKEITLTSENLDLYF